MKITMGEGLHCIVVGDIEGEMHKLKPLLGLIDANPGLQFVFLGDLWENLSQRARERRDQLECLRMISKYLQDGSDYEGVASFRQLAIVQGNFMTNARVQFIAGNHETDVLNDLMNVVVREDGMFSFPGAYPKVFNGEELLLLYRYYKSLRSELIWNVSEEQGGQGGQVQKVIRFRHGFSISYEFVGGAPREQKHQRPKEGNVLIVAGHSRKVAVQTAKGSPYLFQIDTSRKKDEVVVLSDSGCGGGGGKGRGGGGGTVNVMMDQCLGVVGIRDEQLYAKLMLGWFVDPPPPAKGNGGGK
jgi:hypothetical protein